MFFQKTSLRNRNGSGGGVSIVVLGCCFRVTMSDDTLSKRKKNEHVRAPRALID